MGPLATAIEQANEAIMITDRSGAIVYVNPSFEQRSGYSRDELMGKNPRILQSGLEKQSFYRELWETIERGEVWSNCIFNKKKDGTLFVEHMTISPIKDDAGQIQHYLAIKRDVTRERALEFQLQQTQNMASLGGLSSGIAHEINTPTQFIGDYARFLKDAFAGLDSLLVAHESLLELAKSGGDASALIEKIEALREDMDLDFLREEIPGAVEGALGGVEKITTIVRAMKEFSQPDAEEKVGVDLNHVLENTITVARNEWKYVSDVKADLAADLPQIPGHAKELKEVFLCLIFNAAEAIEAARTDDSSEKGSIDISTRRDGDWIEVRVRDCGVGMPPGMESRVFEPYFTTKEVDKGTGQGLAIAQYFVVDRHQGTIQYESEIGEGTTFIVRLPVVADSSETHEA